jgi:HAD superfamily phosphoserine phosphatase-like hydrolase
MFAPALVVFDLDGTLLRGATICEVLAESLQQLPRMQEFERLTEQREIVAAREEMAQWYEKVPRTSLLGFCRNARFAPGLDAGISLLQQHGVAIGIASITWDFAVRHFAHQWGIEHCLATTLHDSGAIGHVWPDHKPHWMLELAAQYNVPRNRVAAIGDSAGDYGMLEAAGVPIFVGAEASKAKPGWIHWPDANIGHLAQHLIDLWADQELHDNMEQPTRSRAQSGRRPAQSSWPGCSS